MPTLSRRLLTPLAALALLGAALPASAAWESIGGCPASSRAKLKPGDNRPLRLTPGFKGDIVVYGHLLDTVRSVNITGITGASASDPRGTNGFVNGGSGVVGRMNTPDFCGLGSLTVKVSVPPTAPRGQRGTLLIGGERIPLEVVTDSFSTRWDARNDSASLTPGTQEQVEAAANANAAAARQTCRANAEIRFQQCQANRPALEAQRAQQCTQRKAEIEAAKAQAEAQRQASGSTGVMVGNPAPPAVCQPLASCQMIRNDDLARCDDEAPRTDAPRAPRCLRDLGGSSLFLPDGTLEITLPPADRATDAQLQTCLARGFDVRLARQLGRTHDYGIASCSDNEQWLVARQTGNLGVRMSQSRFGCTSGDVVLAVPDTLRNTLLAPTRGVITLSHRGGAIGYDLGESPTPLNVVVVPPPRRLEIGNPVVQPPKVGSPILQR